MRNDALVVLVAVLVALSGCSGLDGLTGGSGEDGATANFAQSVSFPPGAVAGEETVVRVTVNNTGATAGTFDAGLTVDDETVTSESVSVGSNNTTTLTLTHTFETAGEYDLTVGEVETTLTVYETPRAFVSNVSDEVSTATIEEETTMTGTVIADGRSLAFSLDSSATIQKNYSAETLSKTEESTNEVGDTRWEESTEAWVVDGTRYSKTTDKQDDETTYEREPDDEFEDSDTNISDEAVVEYLDTDHTDEEYVFVVDAPTPAEATDLWRSVNADDDLPAESLVSFSMEMRFDRETGRATERVVQAELEEYDVFERLEMTIREEVVSTGDPVNVTVPAEVKERAERSGTGGDGPTL